MFPRSMSTAASTSSFAPEPLGSVSGGYTDGLEIRRGLGFDLDLGLGGERSRSHER